MVQVYQNIGHIILMLLLIGCSAFFSGSETAFFNLSRRQVDLFRKSRHKLQTLVAKLLSKPRQLLSCILFGNMMVNILFYAIASIFIVKIERQVGLTTAAITAAGTFVLLVLFGEILPKSIAYANSRPFSVTAALPMALLLRIFTPIVSVFRFLLVDPVIRLLLGPPHPAKPITSSEFKLLIQASQKRGLITADENKLLTEVVELAHLKVYDCLQPRVDMVACDVTTSILTARQLMLKNHLTKLPVYVGSIDNIVGLVPLRQILLRPDISLDKLVQQVNFVPEQKTIESLLEFFRKTHTDTAIVVDEYGGIAGSIRLEDIAEELLGPIEVTGEIEPIEQTGPFEYRLAGDLAIGNWADMFGIDPAETKVYTIAGLVTAILGKIPKTGDVARLKNLKFTVEQVQKHRIKTLILTFEPVTNDD
ncbi:MAG: HlyC/CorC family transporter [Planctomycetes bacterium]|nr:HlyC/CorC family transporter [Planctomycetota bacterium]